MIYFNADTVGWPLFDGEGGETPVDHIEILQGNDPAVLEQRINAAGFYQNDEEGRGLAGIQIGGGGKGGDFTVMMLFVNTTTSMPPGIDGNEMRVADASSVSAGLNVFLFSAESEPELNLRKQDALARARAFVTGHDDPEWRGFELAGSNDGRTFMGMLVVRRGDETQI